MQRRWVAYGVAIGAVAAASLLRWVLDPLLGDAAPFLTYLVAVVAASWMGGRGPALLATLLSVGAASYLFVPPRGALLAEGAKFVALALFVAAGLAIAALGERMRGAVRRAQRAEDEVRAQGEVRLPFELAGVGHTEIDLASGRFVRVNRAFCEMTGYSRDELLALTAFDITHPEDIERKRAALAPVMSGESDRFEFEKRYVRKDGRAFHARVTSLLTRDAAGRPARLHGSIVDVGERWRKEQELRESEARFRRTFDNAPIGIGHVALDGSFILCNSALCDITGYAVDELRGRRFPDITHLDDRAEDDRLNRLLLDGRIPRYTRQKRCIRKDGGVVWIEVTMSLSRDDDGRPEYFIGALSDVTARRAAQARLLASEERFRQVFEKSATGIAIIADDGRFLSCNPAFCTIYGRSEEDLLRTRAAELVHPEDVAESHARLEHLRSGSVRSYEIEHRALRPDGSVVVVSKYVTTLQDVAGERRYVALVTDVTFRRRAETALRESERRYRSLTEGMPHIVWECNRDGECMYLNRAWYDYTGARPGASTGHAWLDHFDARDVVALLASWGTSLRSNGEVPYDLYARMRRHDGAYRWFRVIGARVLGDDGETARWVGTCTDVHDVRELIAALQEADQRKDEFLATLAHELRNPLAPIRNAVEYLKLKGPAEPSQTAARAMIERQLAQMVRLIDDLLDVSRITRGKLELRRERVGLHEVVRQALDTARPNIEAAGHVLEVRLPESPVHLDVDLVRLAQVFANLLNNAAKYTEPPGTIVLEAQVTPGEVLIRVQDTGVGIPPGKLEQVFDMFTQIEHRPGVDRGGLGIGLTLVKRLVEMHGGTVEAHSEGAGRGSEFIVRLPRPAEDLTPARVALDPDASTWPTSADRVLIVDDNRDAAISLAMVMNLTGCETEVAHDGLTALDLAQRTRPDLVLLDLGLPGMDGHAVCRALRASPLGQGMTIIAITGWGQDEDRRRSQAAGFDGHLVKPVEYDALLGILKEIRRRREQQAVAP